MTNFIPQADSAVGTWIDARDLRVGDVYAHSSPGASCPMVEHLVKSVRTSYSRHDMDSMYAAHVTIVECSFPGKPTKPSGIDKLYAYNSGLSGKSTVFLVRRVTRQQDVDRLERELAEARANLRKQAEAERSERINRAADVLQQNADLWSIEARHAARALDDAGLLVK